MEKDIKKKKQRNHSLDLLKFISSFMIVCIHFKFFGNVGEFATIIARFAVPVFFMISGYYSYGNDITKIKNKIINVLKMYFVAVVIYFCFNVSVKVFNGQINEAVWYVSTYLRPQYTVKTILFNESITAIHLWFLGSLIYLYFIRWFVIKMKIKDNIIHIISVILLAINLVFGIGFSSMGIDLPAFMSETYIMRNFLFTGFPLFTLGQLIKKEEEVISDKLSSKALTLIIILSILDSVMVCTIDWTKDLYIGSVLMAFALFIIALKLKDKTYPTKMLALFRTSTNVYIIHVLLGDIMTMTALNNMQFYLLLKPVIIFLVSVIIALVINKIKFLKKQK